MSNEPEHSRFKGWLAIVPTIIAAIGGLISIPVSFYSCHNADVAQRLNIIGVEVQWQSLLDGYETVNKQVMELEKTLKLQKGGPQIENQKELEEYLSTKSCPPELAKLYLDRLDKYESLRNAAAQYRPFKSRLSRIDLELPILPRLIKLTAKMEGGSVVGGEAGVSFRPAEGGDDHK